MNIKKVLKLIEKTRKQETKVKELENQIFSYFGDKDIDLKSCRGGCNSDNLEEMICCYIAYGEDSIEEIEKRLKEIEVLYE